MTEPRYYVKRTDGKVYAGYNRRGAAIFVHPTAGGGHWNGSLPRSLPQARAEEVAMELTLRGHEVRVRPEEELYIR